MSEYFSKKRLIFLFAFLIIFALYIIFSYGKLAFIPSAKTRPLTYLPERGSILDRNGKVLAFQTNFYHVGVSPSGIKDAEMTAKLIAPTLQITAESIINMIKNAPGDFTYIKKKIEQFEYDELQQIIKTNHLTGIRFDKIPGRIYPENDLASQVIGFMGNDGKGLSGIELTQDSLLFPKESLTEPSVRGKDIYLTIDANLQYKLEKIAKETLHNTKAESFMLLASNAKTGEILSYISLPSANLNTYPTATEMEKTDRPTGMAFEPGSVFKIFSVATFLTSKAIDINDKFYCDGKFEKKSGSEKIKISCLGHHGNITAKEALQYSCNDAIAQMSELIPAEMFLHYINAMGFGQKTGIELPGETTGSVKNTNHKYWSARSKPTMSIGQEISVSAVQMIQATSAIANKGFPIKPSIISQIVNSDGTLEYEHKPIVLEQVFTENAANYLIDCMESTAKSGTGRKALIGDVSIGVKTGTAQMIDNKTGQYSETNFLSNCVAIFPTEDPKIILYIVIAKAQGETYAGRIVAPVIADAADIIIDHLGLARANAASLAHTGKISITQTSIPTIKNTVPNFYGLSKRQLTPLLERTDFSLKIIGDGWVVNQKPVAGTTITENMTIELYLE
ncbi:MAG: transpeptidase family protein [Treponema sp.]|nr:transpeptidase family protein [Treponema sp.]